MLKRILATALAAAMIFGLASVAFAGPFSDTAGSTNEKAIVKLASLALLKGYEDGTFKPAGNITRAEFAAVVVRALGLETSAKLLIYAPAFKDAAQATWAWGYINVASAQGIVKGYPDGTFAPNANVTVAEAVTMLVRALGRDAQAVGTWPSGHIMVAAQQGMLPSDLPGVDVAATRGIVAQLVTNVLDKPFGYQDKDTGLWLDATNNTFLVKNSASILKARKVVSVDTTDNIIELLATEDEDDNPEPDITAGCYFVGASKLADFLNQTVDVLLNDDGDAVYIGSTTTSGLSGKVTAVDLTAKTITLNSVVYAVKDTAYVKINGTEILGDAVAKITDMKNAEVVIVLDSTGKVISITGTNLDKAGTITGKMTAIDGGSTVNHIFVDGNDVVLKSTVTIVKNGGAATYADLQIGDTVKYNLVSGKATYVDAFLQKIIGTLQAKAIINNHASYKINDVTYIVAVDEDGYDVPTGDPTVVIGEVVVLSLNRDGKITKVERPSTTATVALTIAGKNETWTTTGAVQTLTLSNGSIVTLGATPTITRNSLSKTFSSLKTGDIVVMQFGISSPDVGKVTVLKAFATTSGTIDSPVPGSYQFTIHSSTGSDLALVNYVVNQSTLMKNGIQTIVTAGDTDITTGVFRAGVKVKIVSWTVNSFNEFYANLLVRDTTISAVAKGSRTVGESVYLVLREAGADKYAKVTTTSILHRSDAVVASTGILVGDKVVVAIPAINGGTGDLATPYVITYLNGTADSDAPEYTTDPHPTATPGLTVEYAADEQHIMSYKVYLKSTGVLVNSVSGVEKDSGTQSFLWLGLDDDGDAAAPGNYTIVITIKDYAGNAQDPFAVSVTK